MATSRTWTDADGQEQTMTEWSRCTSWGKLAEIAAQYLHKGSCVDVAGRLHISHWEDVQTGAHRSSMEIILDDLILLDRPMPAVAMETDQSVGETQPSTLAPSPRASVQQPIRRPPQPVQLRDTSAHPCRPKTRTAFLHRLRCRMHDHPAPPPVDLLDAYARSLADKAAGTIDAYVRAVQRLTISVAQRPGSGGSDLSVQFSQNGTVTRLTRDHNISGQQFLRRPVAYEISAAASRVHKQRMGASPQCSPGMLWSPEWPDGRKTDVDAVIWCTGFRPALDHLASLGVVEDDGRVVVSGTRCVREPRL